MDYRPDWIDGTDEPAIAVLASNTMSKMARRADQITEEVAKIKQRVDRTIHTFERTHGVLSSNQGPDMEIMENMDELESILHDQDQKRKYQQKLTVFIVGFQETCGQRRHLLTQLQEFFSIHSSMNEVEGDQYLGQPCVDLDGIAFQVTGAVRSAETAMSRLTELHKVVMSHLSQAVSAGTQAKWKPSDDRGKKKLEKLLQQARQDIGQLTDQLLQTKEEVTLKDQQVKELQKQNEMRMMEINHVKSQMEVTKKSLHIVQKETAIQRSLLEVEIRRQAGQLEVFESQKAVKAEELTDSSTQWEIEDCMFRCSDENMTANNEESFLEESMEAADETPLKDINDEHNKMQELISIDTDDDLRDDIIKPESQEFPRPSFPVLEENISATSLPPIAEKDNIVHTSSKVEEYNSTSHLSPHNKSCVTPPLSSPVIQAVQQGVNDASQLNLAKSIVVPQENTSVGNKFEPVRLLPMANKNDQSAIPQQNSEITDSSDVSFPMPGNGSYTTAPYNGSDQVNHAISSSERYNSPVSNEVAQSAHNSEIILLVPNRRSSPMIPLVPDEDTNPIKSTDIPNTDIHLKNPVFAPNLELDENTYKSPTTDNPYTAPESNQDANGSISLSAPDKKTQYFASFPVIHQTTDLNTSSPPLSSGIHSNTLPLTNMNINMDQSLWTTLHSLTDIKTLPNKAPTADLTAKATERSHISISNGSRHQSSEPCMLNDTLLEAENKTGSTSHAKQEEATTVKMSDIGTHHTELSKRLQKCVGEIRNLLITEGFQSLADMLAKGLQDETEEGLSTNLTQLENFPTVLQNLLHNIARKSTERVELTKEHSPDSVIRNEEDKIDSLLPVKHTEGESQKCDRLSVSTNIYKEMKTRLSYDLGHTSSLIFTRTDEEHNKRELQWASCQGRIPIHINQEISRMMSKYRILSQEKLRCLVWGYVQYISWNRAENLLRRQCHSRPQINPVLYKLQKKKYQAFLQWKDKILQSQEQRLRLSAVLNQALRGVQEDTGLFLVKPQISWAGSSVLETCKQISSSKISVQQSCFSPQCQDGIICHGISPTNVANKWKYMHTHTELRPLVVTPKLLEMDIQRYLCKDCCVMSQLQHCLHGSPLKKASTQRNLVHVNRTAAFPAV